MVLSSAKKVLHELLALDPKFRVTQTWEVDYPFPPPETASYESDPRITDVQKMLETAAAMEEQSAMDYNRWANECGANADSVEIDARVKVCGEDHGILYDDDVCRAFSLATVVWGIVALLLGVIVATQLSFWQANLNTSWLSFGRLRPLHTSAVIFAFGGNALLATSFYVVQRTCRTRLWGGPLPMFVVIGYQLFICLAASGYLLGFTQSKEYAEPEWYVDLWLTIVWVCYFLVFVGTIVKRKEPHIYVANWFFLAFIITVEVIRIVVHTNFGDDPDTRRH